MNLSRVASGLSLHSYLKRMDSLRAHDLLGPAEGRVLDLGCGAGEDLPSLARRGWNVVGLEPFQTPRAGPWARGTADRIPFRDDSFDAVACVLVLPHLPRPEHAVAEVLRVLRRGGTSVFVVFSLSPLNVGVVFRKARPSTSNLRAVCRLYTHRSIERLLSRAGFRIEAIVRMDHLPWFLGMAPLSLRESLYHWLERHDVRIASSPFGAFARKLVVAGVKP
jgi:ubiquinone/menaquinone biosynthesis C-methylase UbiE